MQKTRIIVTLLVIISLLVISIVGCSSKPSNQPTSTLPPEGVMQLPAGVEPAVANPDSDRPWIDPTTENSLIDKTWVDPGKIWVNNLYMGAKAESPELPAIRMHHGGVTIVQVSVTTADFVEVNGEKVVDNFADVTLPIEATAINSVTSSNKADNPTIRSHSGSNLVVVGLKTDSQRILTIAYEYIARFAIVIRPPDYTDTNYEPLPAQYYDWITLEYETIMIGPRQTVEVPVYIDVLNSAPGRKFEVWISVMDITLEKDINTELCTRWFLSMQ